MSNQNSFDLEFKSLMEKYSNNLESLLWVHNNICRYVMNYMSQLKRYGQFRINESILECAINFNIPLRTRCGNKVVLQKRGSKARDFLQFYGIMYNYKGEFSERVWDSRGGCIGYSFQDEIASLWVE